MSAHRFPTLRWFALAWLAVYLPAYYAAYGGWHFLFLCNTGICLTALGVLFDKPLLLSSQAVAAPSIAVLWIADAGARIATGQHLHGGTAYLWDPSIPWLVRVLSLYHLAWPIVLAWCLRRTGYDARGFVLQALIACSAFAIGLWLAPAVENLNYVHRWPLAAAAHPPWRIAAMLCVLIGLVYWPTHRLIMLAVQHRERLRTAMPIAI